MKKKITKKQEIAKHFDHVMNRQYNVMLCYILKEACGDISKRKTFNKNEHLDLCTKHQ